MTEIPGVKVEFEARVAEAIAKIEELKAAIRSIGNDRNSVVHITDGGSTRRTADDARRDMRRAADDTERDWRSAFRRIQSDNDGALGRMVRDSRRAGGDSARNFRRGAEDEARRAGPNRSLGLAPGGQRANWGALIGLTLPAIAPAAAGLAAPIAGAFEVALPAALSTVAILPIVRDSFTEVTKAASALETQQNKFNAAAGRTAIALKTDSVAAQNYASLLQGLNPAEQDLVAQLSKQDVSWTSLTKTQQIGAIQLKENKDAYKALNPAQKDALNALIAERAAWVNLNPQQAQALRNYQGMVTTWDKLRDKAQPGVFGAIAVAEQAATDALKPMGPVLTQITLGFTDLFRGMDNWFKSEDYQHFIDMWSGDARKNIDTVGGAIGHVALGIIHMWEALHPMMGPSESWLTRITQKFADWPQTPKGQTQFQNFLHDITTQGPLVWGTLKNTAQSFDKLVAALAGNPLPWLVLKDVTAIMKWIASAPGGSAAINIAAWAFALTRLAQALKLVALYEGALKLLARFGIGSAAGAAAASGAASAAGAAGAAAGGTRVTAGAIRSVINGAEGAAAGGAARSGTAVLSPVAIRAAAAGGGAAAGGASAGLWGAIANPTVAIAALVAGAAVAGYAINKWGDTIQKKSDEAAGVVRKNSYEVVAAATDNGVRTSKAFQDLANSYGRSSGQVGQSFDKATSALVADSGGYVGTFDKSNAQIKDVMYLGRTEFGQETGLFVSTFGQNVADIGKTLRAKGKSVNQALLDSMDAVFKNGEGRAVRGWDGYDKTWYQAQEAHFKKVQQTTQTDYNGLTKAVNQYTDDMRHSRDAKEKGDITALFTAINQYETDANKGLIDKSHGRILQLSTDLAQYMGDAMHGDSKAAKNDIEQLGRDVAGSWSAMADSMGSRVNKLFNQQLAVVDGRLKAVSPRFQAAGGYIAGPGTGTSDSIPAYLSNGEFVINAAATSRHRGLLEAINSRGYAQGGPVGNNGSMGLTGESGLYVGAAWEINFLKNMRQAVSRLEAASAAPGGGDTGAHSGAARAAQAYARSMLGSYGWGLNQMGSLTALWNGESGWNPYAVNPSSGAYGIPQSLGHGHPYALGDYQAQVRWGMNYIRSSYGSPNRAYSMWLSRNPHWYDEGGVLPPGLSMVMNQTRKPEAVLNAAQWRAVESLATGGANCVLHNVVEIDGRAVWENTRRVNLQQQRRNGKSTFSYGTQRIL